MRKEPNQIPYTDIFKNAWQITWKNRFLWWFGLFLSLAAGFSINWNGGNWNNSDPREQAVWQKISAFFSEHPGLIPALVGITIALYIVFVILAALARGGAIKSIDYILKNQPAGFRPGMVEGKKYFWPILSLSIILFFFIALSAIVLFTPVFFLFFSRVYFGGILLAACAVLIFIPLIILASFVKTFGYIYIALGELGFRPAIENAYDLFLKNILTSIIMALLFFPISLLLGLSMIFILLIFLFIFGAMAALAYFTAGLPAAVVIGGIGALLFIAAILAIRSVYEIFSQTAWIMFFREIAVPTEEEKIAEKEEEEKEVSAPKALPTGDVIKTIESEE